ncbi:MAG: glycosyltransferase family 4 protein [Halothiobacillus sp.]
MNNESNNMNNESNKKIKVLIEMRPALDGFAGIPQEVRLLFRGLSKIDSVAVEGLLQSPHRRLAKGTKEEGLLSKKLSNTRKINRYSRVIISLAETPYRNMISEVYDYIERRIASAKLVISSMLGISKIKLTRFESKGFEDFTWRTFFSKTLPASDFELVSSANHRICSTALRTMHRSGLNTLNMSSTPVYPVLDTKCFDVFIGQTPYPARVPKNTTLVIRYHDAIPVLMPHTISDKSIHQATHFYALMGNVNSGAWFSCVSEATRQDLIRLFPEAEERAVTIYNMVSHHYFKEESSFDRVPNIIRSRSYGLDPHFQTLGLLPNLSSLREEDNFFKKHVSDQPFKYLLIVSTIEPRKNHLRLVAAFESIKAEVDPDLKIIIVGTLGWNYDLTVRGFKTWIDRGDIFMLNAVPAPDLRILYRHAFATVCPSLGEGFDFSGVESMASGGITIASDIPVHREVYDDAAEYFNPYSTNSLVTAFKKVLYAADAPLLQDKMRIRGEAVSSRYLPEKILPQWEAFLKRVVK